MTLSRLGALLISARNVIGATLVIGSVLVSAAGMLKVPAQQTALTDAVHQHAESTDALQRETNKKLDVLICLQAHLDLPIRCVAIGK